MKFSKLWSSALISAFVIALFALPVSMFADTYEIINLGGADSNSVYGMDAAGDVVIRGFSGCGALFFCYQTYVDGVVSSMSATAPTMDYDDGTTCKPTAQATHGACNGAYEAFGSGQKVYIGDDGAASFLVNGSVDAIVMNSVGDFAWTDGLDEYNYEAIDLSTSPVPEPSSLLLLATGVLSAAGVVRRRFV